jgi:hypothetical protein
MGMNRKMVLGEAEVDNPYFAADHPENGSNPKRVRALINVRESAVVTLFNRGYLKQHQFRAAVRFNRTWEIMNGRRGGSFSEHVDGYRHPSISSSVIDAGKELQQCQSVLLGRQYRLVCEVCGQGRSLAETSYVKDSDRRNKDTARLTAADYLRDSLDDLACMWGYMHRKGVDTTQSARA